MAAATAEPTGASAAAAVALVAAGQLQDGVTLNGQLLKVNGDYLKLRDLIKDDPADSKNYI